MASVEFKPYFVIKINTSGLDLSGDRVSELSIIYEDMSYLNSSNNPELHLCIKLPGELSEQANKYSKVRSLSQDFVEASEAASMIREFVQKYHEGDTRPTIAGFDMANFTVPFLRKDSLVSGDFLDIKDLYYLDYGRLPSKHALYTRKGRSVFSGEESVETWGVVGECYAINALFWDKIRPYMGM